MDNNKGETNGEVTSRKQRVDFSTSEGLEKMSKRIRYAYNKLTGGATDADDCVQEVLCRMLEGKHKHSTIDFAVIDYLRLQSGRKGSASYTKRRNLASPDLYEQGQEVGATRFDYGRELDCRRIVEFIATNLRGNKGDAIRMIVLEDFNLKEAGEKLGLSESRICQYVKEFQDKMAFLIKLPEDVRRWAASYVI